MIIQLTMLYFITICTQDRRNLFGEIVGAIHELPEMRYSDYGIIVAKQIEALPNRYPEAKIDAFCVTPNHVHLIIALDNERAIRESLLRRSVLS